MKILQLTYSLSSGGGERLLVDLSNRLAQNPSNEVIIVTILTDKEKKNTHYRKDVSDKIKYINLDCPGGLKPKSLYRVYKVIKHEKPDIVHAHCNLMAIYFPSLLNRQPKYVHTLHSLATFCIGGKWQKFVNKFIYNRYVQAVTISKECLLSYRELYKKDNSIMVTNGREPQSTTPFLSRVIEEVDSYKHNADTPVFVHVARNHPVKNQELLFKTFDYFYINGVDALLLVLGSGHEENRKLYQSNPEIRFIGEKNNVSDYLAVSDFFIMSSILEGLPLSLLEAMSMGLVPISTPAGGVQDVVRNDRNGYISKDHSFEEFKKIVLQAIEEKGRYSPDDIKADYESNYSMKVCAEKYSEVFKQLLKR